MKINFKELNVKTSFTSEETVKVDAREAFANILYSKVNGIAALTLAQKIYNSDGEEEFDERESSIIKECAENFMIPAVIEALNIS